MAETEQTVQRDKSIDYAKGIGIMLVILGHISQIEGEPRVFITSFHMPLFFVISGILINKAKEEERPITGLFKKKVRRMLIPYAWFSLLTIMIYTVVNLLHRADADLIVASLRTDLLDTISFSGRSVLWFLPALLVSEMVFLMLLKKAGRIPALSLSILFAAIGVFSGDYLTILFTPLAGNIFFVWLYDLLTAFLRSMICLVFLAAGYFISTLCGERKQRKQIYLAAGLILLLIAYFISRTNGITDLHFRVFGNPVLYLTAALAGSFGVLSVSKALDGEMTGRPLAFLAWFGENSLTVMVTHLDFYVLYAAEVGATFIAGHMPRGTFTVFILATFVFTVIGEGILIQIINRFFPFLLGKRKANYRC